MKRHTLRVKWSDLRRYVFTITTSGNLFLCLTRSRYQSNFGDPIWKSSEQDGNENVIIQEDIRYRVFSNHIIVYNPIHDNRVHINQEIIFSLSLLDESQHNRINILINFFR